ncbi:lipid A biosynthesis lauroyl acyltransferase [Neisseria zoodegmatis]|uniref:Lipid A biosynthesis lauroyl acyltransferase n=1 Tax=Neisseria zoodegmatis TaxID=326523 RepID=A0AB38DP93_9NEIS|nr:lipid A biosynthesis lauroyl acyltransferase [Neisseria zoodegmatis]OSI09644.1 lipid A biosynthesis lauroyl acyltransferase [Neisseria zoodegmatis]SNU78916.1 lipid A biosynthesis lauroyl acyltransferase [Neisseria zoodegmatis]
MKFAFIILYLIQLLPFGMIQKLADFIGWLAYYAVAPRRRVGTVNLQKCFPEWSETQRQAVLKRHFQHMAKLMLEYGLYWYTPAERLRSLVRYQDKHHLDNALAAGEKVILLYPHFTAFEMAVYTLNQDVPLISMYSHQKNKALDEQILKGRHRYNNVFLLGRNDGLRAIIKQLRQNDAPFLYLPDQDFGRKDSIFVNFFGIQAATIEGLSRIAALTKAKVIPAIPTREADGTVTLRFYPAWENFPTDNVVNDTQRMNDFIEARVREQPEQYFWLHKRFKTRPEGEAGFY